jgi:hypothetical protein
MKNGLKMKFKKKKEKKKTSSAPLSAQTAQRPVGQHPRRPTSPPLLFLFPRDADTSAPPVSLPFPFPFFFFLSLPNRPGAAAQSPPRPAVPLPSLPLSTAN